MNFRKRTELHPAGFNITPLIDILLVLIIFFVLTWNLGRDEQEVNIKVPTAKESAETRARPGEIILNIRQDGTVFLYGKSLDAEQLLDTLKRVAKEFPDQAITLRGDRNLPLQQLMKVMDVCSAADIRNVSFATTKEASP
jgi:biopolymer transport protein ExbD